MLLQLSWRHSMEEDYAECNKEGRDCQDHIWPEKLLWRVIREFNYQQVVHHEEGVQKPDDSALEWPNHALQQNKGQDNQGVEVYKKQSQGQPEPQSEPEPPLDPKGSPIGIHKGPEPVHQAEPLQTGREGGQDAIREEKEQGKEGGKNKQS